MRYFKRYSILFFILFVTIVVSCSLNSAKSNTDKNENQIAEKGIAQIKFDTLFHDFGNIIEGEKVAITFRFKNTGTSELIIFDAFSACGCTVPKYDKEPILPSKEGRVEVVFDSSNRSGIQTKTVTLKTNAPMSETTLWIKANVKSNN